MVRKIGLGLLIIGMGLLTLVGVLVVVVATRPASFKIERTASMAVPPDVVQSFVQDFHQWGQWSPWEHLDPNLKRTFEGAQAGVGAKYSWAGNDQVGEGRMTIESVQPNQSVTIKLEFLRPFEATNTTVFTFKASGSATDVTWTMSGDNNFVGKAFSLVMDMDKMVGKDFETGLANLKTVAEAEAKKPAE
jgi:hypothetical protein